MMQYYLYPIIGGVIGYATNCIAVKMTVHWLIPKKREEIYQEVIDNVVPEFLPNYIKVIPAVRKKFLKDTADLANDMSVTELIRIVSSIGYKEFRFIEVLGGIIGTIIGGVILLL